MSSANRVAESTGGLRMSRLVALVGPPLAVVAVAVAMPLIFTPDDSLSDEVKLGLGVMGAGGFVLTYVHQKLKDERERAKKVQESQDLLAAEPVLLCPFGVPVFGKEHNFYLGVEITNLGTSCFIKSVTIFVNDVSGDAKTEPLTVNDHERGNFYESAQLGIKEYKVSTFHFAL